MKLGIIFLILIVTTSACQQLKADAPQIAALTEDEIICLETSNAPDGQTAVTQCLKQSITDPNLWKIAISLFEQRKLAEKAQPGYAFKVPSKDGGQ